MLIKFIKVNKLYGTLLKVNKWNLTLAKRGIS